MKPRLLAVGRAYDLSAAPFDGFVLRRRYMLEALSRDFDIRLLPLRFPGDEAVVNGDLPGEVLTIVDAEPFVESKRERLRNLARLRVAPGIAPWENTMHEAVVSSGADVAFTCGPWLDPEYRSVFATLPALHVFEEDVTRMIDIAPQSMQARGLRRAEAKVRQLRVARPRVATVIAPSEVSAARQRFGRACDIRVIPQTLHPSLWPKASEVSEGDAIFCVGAMNQARQADGLMDFLSALSARGRPDVRVDILSAGGLHPMLASQVEGMSQVRLLPPESDVVSCYRNSRMALVPARRATGMKATILQAWQTGCPVVTYSASAATMGFPDAVAAASDAQSLVGLALELWDSPRQREQLASQGMAACEHFSHDRWFGEVVRLARELADT